MQVRACVWFAGPGFGTSSRSMDFTKLQVLAHIVRLFSATYGFIVAVATIPISCSWPLSSTRPHFLALQAGLQSLGLNSSCAGPCTTAAAHLATAVFFG